MINRSTFVGSALSLLFVFSVISYPRTFIQRQDPKPAQNQPAVVLEVAGQVPEATEAAPATASPASLAGNSTANSDSGITLDFVVAPETYTATAYSLRGRTASGKMVSRGLIAADPRVLPLGSRVRVEAGSWSGEYLVADTGGAIKGRRIDIWTTTTREALQFGRRTVKLTVLEFGGKRAKSVAVRPRRVNGSAPVTSPMVQTPNKQDQ